MTQIKLLQGDCLDKLKELEDNSVDSIVTDPPYHLTSIVKRFGKKGSAPAQYGTDGAYARAAKGFMGKEWDGGDIAFRTDVWEECYRVLKPGGHLLAFSHSRTYHRMGVAVEDAGFEIRDQILWVYGSGFPKSHNVGNSIDKLNGAGNRGHAISSGNRFHPTTGKPRPNGEKLDKYEARTEEGKGWEGWGTALKPAHEPIVMARKPLSEKTVARNVLEWGTGGINIDECRIGTTDSFGGGKKATKIFDGDAGYNGEGWEPGSELGRFPANIIFDEEAGKILDEQSDTGGASRFFYCPKASKKDRNEGLDHIEDKQSQIKHGTFGRETSVKKRLETSGENSATNKNVHPTVKPTDLMAYLVRLVTPKGGVVLDPFMGSGSTGKAAIREGMDFIGIEREDEYMEIAKTRIEHEQSKHNYRNFWE